jgi:bacterioferritin-associated ferredoxin
MNATKLDTENDVLCYCSGTTVQQIKQLLNDGIVDPERISRITGTASGCGSCEFDFQQLLDEHN